jgi:hypothetical protein
MNTPSIGVGNSPEKSSVIEGERDQTEQPKPVSEEPLKSPKSEVTLPKPEIIAPPQESNVEQPKEAIKPAEPPKEAKAELKKLYGSSDIDPADLTEQISDLQEKN